MADAETTDGRTRWDRTKDFLKTNAGEIGQAVGAEIGRGVADVGSTYQAVLYSGWNTQSVGHESPEMISERLAREAEQNKLEPEREGPRVGLEKE